jgi:16S rRNA (guanine527-N7)-methyltransferase
VRKKFIAALSADQEAFGLELSDTTIERLADYYELVQRHNPLLHLVGPCSPEEFAIRHILESLTLLDHLQSGARIADVGTGAGLPAIPCLLAREDLSAILIESKQKKAGFLDEALIVLGLKQRAKVVNRQFEETVPGESDHVTCRALDKFTQKLPKLLKWTGGRKLLLFGGPSLRQALASQGTKPAERLMPLSDQRFLFVVLQKK